MKPITNSLSRKGYLSHVFKRVSQYLCIILLISAPFSPIFTPTASARSEVRALNKSKRLTVKDALEKLKEHTGYSIWFNVKDVNLTRQVSVNFDNKNITGILDEILAGQPLTYDIQGKTVRIYKKATGSDKVSGYHMLTGVVTDAEDGSPITGCTVRSKDRNVASITDIDGRYSIMVNGDDTLEFLFLGYEPQQRVAGSANKMDVKLSSNSVSLNDVVVTGYQVLKKYNVTGSVNTISSKDIDLRSTNSLEGILEGAVPGLTVYNNEYRIRGGATLQAGNKPLFIVDDFEVEELPENMDMVESITVLKDASAAAIWGSRAANGVIVITTKKGKADDFRISYSGNIKVGARPDFDDLHRVNSEQLIDYDRSALLGEYYFPGYFGYSKSGYSLSQAILNDYALDDMSTLTQEQLAEMDSRLAILAKNNNRKQIEDNLMRNSFQQQHLLSISGGTKRVKYFLSGSYIGGHSSYVGDDNKSININSRTSYNVLPFLTLRSDIIANFTKNDNGYTSLASDIYNMYPFQMLLDGNGNRVADYSSFNQDFSKTMVEQYGYYDQGKNLLDEIDLANNKTDGINYKVRVGTDFNIMNGLKVSADYQYEKAKITYKNITSKKSYGGRTLINQMAEPSSTNSLIYHIPNGDILDHQESTTDAWILKLGATLDRNFGANREHYVNAVAGFEMRSRHYYSEKYRKLGYDDQLLSWQPIDAVSLQNGIQWWNGDKNRYYSTSYDGFGDVLNKEISYFLSGVYTYDNRYTLSGSMRIDKSNLFGVSDKYRKNPIWAIGANWNVKNEAFFQPYWVSALMLRASWGLTGNFDRSGSTTPVMVGTKSYIPAIGDYVVRLSTPPNPQLRWERNRSTNVSMDLGLFNRVNATVTYYHNRCYDLLGSTLLDPTTGYENARINAADMTNKGFEIQLGVTAVNLRDFRWNLNWIFAHNNNKITNNKIKESVPYLNRVTGITEFVEGYAREAIWSYRWAGLDAKGEPMVYNKDGEKLYDVAKLSAEDLEYSGTYQPKFNGSFSSAFQYKNLYLSLLFTYNFGHVFRAEYPSMDAYATSPSLSDKIADRWRVPGDENKTDIACLPAMIDNWANTNYRSYAVQYSSNSIRKGDMIRLREIMLNYECPQSWLKNTPLRRLSLTAQINNVWLWTKNKEGYDPEALNPVNGHMSLRQPLTFTAGIKVDF